VECAPLRARTAPYGVYYDTFMSLHLLCRFIVSISPPFFLFFLPFFLSHESCAYLLVLFDGAGQWMFPAPSREGVWEVWGGTGRAGGGELLRGEENGGSRGRAPAHILEERGARGKGLMHGGYRRREGLVTCAQLVGGHPVSSTRR